MATIRKPSLASPPVPHQPSYKITHQAAKPSSPTLFQQDFPGDHDCKPWLFSPVYQALWVADPGWATNSQGKLGCFLPTLEVLASQGLPTCLLGLLLHPLPFLLPSLLALTFFLLLTSCLLPLSSAWAAWGCQPQPHPGPSLFLSGINEHPPMPVIPRPPTPPLTP